MLNVATVNGLGSHWTNSGKLTIGDQGIGELDIMNGGTVEGADAEIGRASCCINAVKVGGNNSQWLNSGELIVGAAGLLDISNGGLVKSATVDSER